MARKRSVRRRAVSHWMPFMMMRYQVATDMRSRTTSAALLMLSDWDRNPAMPAEWAAIMLSTLQTEYDGYEHPCRDGVVALPRRHEAPAPDRFERGSVEPVEAAARADLHLVGIAGGIDVHVQHDLALVAEAARSGRIGGRRIVEVRGVEAGRGYRRWRRGGGRGRDGSGRG